MSQPVRKLKQRRALISGDAWVWVDDDGHEREHHVEGDDGAMWWSKHHRFHDEKGQMWAIRCPATLDEKEKIRVFEDIPPGRCVEIINQIKANAAAAAAAKKAKKGDDVQES